MNDGASIRMARLGAGWRAGLRHAMAHRSVALSFLDQGLNSLQSLVMALALVVLADPAVFGTFTFILTCILVAASLQYGATGVAILVHLRARADGERDAALSCLLGADRWLRAIAAALVTLAALAVGGDPAAALSAGLFCAAYLLRETARNIFYMRERAGDAARLGAVSFALFIPLYALFLSYDASATAAFCASAMAMTAALMLCATRERVRPAGPAATLAAYRATFAGTGWTLLNSAANEVQTRLHVFIVQFARGADQLGLLEAGRVLVAPLFLLVSAWQRVGQPRIAALVESRRMAEARRLTLIGLAMVATIASAWFAILYAGWSLIRPLVFANFADVTPYLVGWAAYCIVLISNWSLIMFLNAARLFRTVAFVTISAALATAGLLSVMLLDVPLITALHVLVGVQLAALASFLVLVFSARAPAPRPAQDGRGA